MQYTMEEMESNMTMVYNLRTSTIKGIYTGIHSLESLYGDEAEDYAQIWGSIVIPKDDFILNNWSSFKYDTINNVLVFMPKTTSNFVVQPQ